ncbi:MAG TPA: DUF4340 domain-containing protein [Anaerolineae bacterium]|nr:DUF4340 domain-containing protein [Anaerolineae bacterium]HQH38984.1 DUF4340 domain-containing protein [Anaerolineae bacterium]
MKRQQQILAGILVLQIILGVITFWPKSAATGSSKVVFADVKVEDITALTITDDQGVSITLRKSGDTWVLPDADDFPAQADKITPVLEKLLKLNTANLVARTEASQKQLQVADDKFVRRVDFETADGTKHTFYLGSAPRYTATHFRVAGEVETYLTSEMSTWDLYTAPASWIDTAYAKIDAATLTEIVLENANGTFTLVKSGDAWTLADLSGDEVSAAGKVNDVVSKSTNVVMQRPLGTTEEAGYGLDAPTAVVTLKNTDGGIYTLRVGAKFDGTNYVVKSSESPYYVAVTEYNVKSLVESDRTSFLQQPTPTPTPQP